MRYKKQIILICLLAGNFSLSAQEVVRFDRADAPILTGVKVPAGKGYYYTSGLVASVLDSTASPESYARMGDTYTQSLGILKKIQSALQEAGLSMKDVIFLRVYVVPDKNKNNTCDFEGWFKAYGEYFNNEKNPVKVARSTIGVASLVRPGYLIEIEAVAVVP